MGWGIGDIAEMKVVVATVINIVLYLHSVHTAFLNAVF